ncbi:hypothetical protein BKA69DRAFT_1096982 [Paraphysoderma sedebokerense]|nr:hypothetical protein BKA69DRAFT_1096982 [Paraphysoderma sedebokerense]
MSKKRQFLKFKNQAQGFLGLTKETTSKSHNTQSTSTNSNRTNDNSSSQSSNLSSNSKSHLHSHSHSTTNPPLTPLGSFDVIANSEEICLKIISYLTLPHIIRLSQVNKFWARITNDIPTLRTRITKSFLIPPQVVKLLTSGSIQSADIAEPDKSPGKLSAKLYYENLIKGVTKWKGLALDFATNGYKPYPMMFDIEKITNLSPDGFYHSGAVFSGMCNWISLNDAITQIQGTFDTPLIDNVVLLERRGNLKSEIDNYGSDENLECFGVVPSSCVSNESTGRSRVSLSIENDVIQFVKFTEVQLIRGDMIAIPNEYYGLRVGSVIVGTYDPGFGHEYCGIFAAQMNDAVHNQLYRNPTIGVSYSGTGILANTKDHSSYVGVHLSFKFCDAKDVPNYKRLKNHLSDMVDTTTLAGEDFDSTTEATSSNPNSLSTPILKGKLTFFYKDSLRRNNSKPRSGSSNVKPPLAPNLDEGTLALMNQPVSIRFYGEPTKSSSSFSSTSPFSPSPNSSLLDHFQHTWELIPDRDKFTQQQLQSKSGLIHEWLRLWFPLIDKIEVKLMGRVAVGLWKNPVLSVFAVPLYED